MNNPYVSIIIPTNKCDRYFKDAINSCLNQTFNNFEIILIANGMDKSDYDLIKNYVIDKRIRLYRTDIKLITFSLNLGLHYSLADLIVRMDADDVAYPDRIAKQVKFMDSNLDISICGSFCDLIDGNDNVVGEWKYPITNQKIKKSMYLINPICHPSVMYRKNVILEKGGYMGYYRGEDYALWATMSCDKNIKFANIPEKLIAYRADSTDHPRCAVKRITKASVAGTQFQLFAQSYDIRWLLAALFSICKIIIYKR
jgi:glycosyltransferase involved in cell wall biosynthesis